MKEWLSNFWRKLDYWEYASENHYENFLAAGCFSIVFIIVVVLGMMLIWG